MTPDTPPLDSEEMEKRLAQIEADYAKLDAFYSLSDDQVREVYEHVPFLLQTVRALESRVAVLQTELQKAKDILFPPRPLQ